MNQRLEVEAGLRQLLGDLQSDLPGSELAARTSFRPEDRLVEDLGLDSVSLLTLAVEVEDLFEICLDEQDERQLATLGDLVRVIELKLRKSGGESEH